MLPDNQTNTWCYSKYNKLYFGGEPQGLLVGKGTNYFPTGEKFILCGFLNAGPEEELLVGGGGGF